MIDNVNLKASVLTIALDLPWLKLLGSLWKTYRKILLGWSHEGVYEVLDYECCLELKDSKGMLATVQKREKVRYLQDYITCYQDQAWGDGDILLNYRCSPGHAVDQYRLGHKVYKLISLRNYRNRDDTDYFNIQWNMKKGFLKNTGFWGTAINHRTEKITIKVIFPKDRPPLYASIIESNIQRKISLGVENEKTLSDGRKMTIWENTNPRLYENYILTWSW